MNDIDPIQPAAPGSWPRLVKRRGPEDDEGGSKHKAFEEEPEPDDELSEDEDGQAHIDIRV